MIYFGRHGCGLPKRFTGESTADRAVTWNLFRIVFLCFSTGFPALSGYPRGLSSRGWKPKSTCCFSPSISRWTVCNANMELKKIQISTRNMQEHPKLIQIELKHIPNKSKYKKAMLKSVEILQLAQHKKQTHRLPMLRLHDLGCQHAALR